MAILNFESVVSGNGFQIVRAFGNIGDIWHITIPEGGTPSFTFLVKGKLKFLDKLFQPHSMDEYIIRTRANPIAGILTACVLEPVDWICVAHKDDLQIAGELTELAIGEELPVLKDKHIFIAEGSVSLNGKLKSINTMMHAVSGDVTLIGVETALVLVFELAEG